MQVSQDVVHWVHGKEAVPPARGKHRRRHKSHLSVAGFGTYLHASSYDLDQFLAELQAAGEYMMSQAKEG
jgi:hypothetical protein